MRLSKISSLIILTLRLKASLVAGILVLAVNVNNVNNVNIVCNVYVVYI